eukprot:g6788.t1
MAPVAAVADHRGGSGGGSTASGDRHAAGKHTDTNAAGRDIAIHFRCGDLLHVRNPRYALLRFGWYTGAVRAVMRATVAGAAGAANETEDMHAAGEGGDSAPGWRPRRVLLLGNLGAPGLAGGSGEAGAVGGDDATRGGDGSGSERMQDSAAGVAVACAVIAGALAASLEAQTGLPVERGVGGVSGASADFAALAEAAVLIGSPSTFALWAALLQRGASPLSASAEAKAVATAALAGRTDASTLAWRVDGSDGPVAILPRCALFFGSAAPALRRGLVWANAGAPSTGGGASGSGDGGGSGNGSGGGSVASAWLGSEMLGHETLRAGPSHIVGLLRQRHHEIAAAAEVDVAHQLLSQQS